MTMGMTDELVGTLLGALLVLGFIAFLMWHTSRERFEKRRLRLEEQSRVLDRLGSGAEIADACPRARGSIADGPGTRSGVGRMVDDTRNSDRAIAAFMSLVADAHGRDEPPLDPMLIWLRAGLERRLEREQRARSARLLSFKLSVVALGLSGYVAARFTVPILAELGDVAIMTGLTLAAVAPAVWYLGFRPLTRL